MTAAQFVRRNETYTRETSRAYVTFLLPSLVFVPVLVALIYFLHAGFGATFAGAIVGLAWFVAGLVILKRGAHWRARGLGLFCPGCSAPFIATVNPPDAHGNCSRCGRELIDRDETNERALFTRVEFARAQAVALHFQRKVYGVWITLALVLAVTFPILLMLRAWPRALGNPETWFGIAGFGLVGFGGMVVAALETAARRRALLECPDCRTQLVNESGEAMLADGRCPECGLLLVANRAIARVAPSGSGPTAPTSPKELRERNEHLEYGTRYEYALVVPPALIGIIVVAVLLWSRRRLSSWVYLGMLLGSMAMIAVLLYANRIWERRARRFGLACPACGELLVGGPGNMVAEFVAEHGACKFCGAVLWNAPPPVATRSVAAESHP